MALSISDGTKQKTLDILSARIGVPIKYARVYARWVTRDNHPAGAFTVNLNCYVEDNPDPTQNTPLHYEVGCNLPESEITKMATMDDRAVLYRHLEYILHFQDAQERQASETGFDILAEQSALDDLALELDIETIFQLSE